jgi:4-carboxymuconolactone decarboxylase
MTTDRNRPRTPAKPAAPRFPRLAAEAMTKRQRTMVEEFLRFSLKGMNAAFNMMLRCPEGADRFQLQGEYLRHDTQFDLRQIELAVLVHARLWNDQYEWMLHAPRAAEAGLSTKAIVAIRDGRAPVDLSPDEEAIFRFALELGRDRRLGDSAFQAALAQFGEAGVTDLAFLLGHYSTISMLLAVAAEGAEVEHLPLCPCPFADVPAR